MTGRPIGVCGSGLVDAVAEMLDAGIIDETGRMISLDDAESLPAAIARAADRDRERRRVRACDEARSRATAGRSR